MIQSTHPACLKPLNRAVKANTTERRALPLHFATTNREEIFCFSSQSLPLHVKTQLMTMIKQRGSLRMLKKHILPHGWLPQDSITILPKTFVYVDLLNMIHPVGANNLEHSPPRIPRRCQHQRANLLHERNIKKNAQTAEPKQTNNQTISKSKRRESSHRSFGSSGPKTVTDHV